MSILQQRLTGAVTRPGQESSAIGPEIAAEVPSDGTGHNPVR
jgi:hypothetical protein